jgi:hypothetical protein
VLDTRRKERRNGRAFQHGLELEPRRGAAQQRRLRVTPGHSAVFKRSDQCLQIGKAGSLYGHNGSLEMTSGGGAIIRYLVLLDKPPFVTFVKDLATLTN